MSSPPRDVAAELLREWLNATADAAPSEVDVVNVAFGVSADRLGAVSPRNTYRAASAADRTTTAIKAMPHRHLKEESLHGRAAGGFTAAANAGLECWGRRGATTVSRQWRHKLV